VRAWLERLDGTEIAFKDLNREDEEILRSSSISGRRSDVEAERSGGVWTPADDDELAG
jgi:hypothetical protein